MPGLSLLQIDQDQDPFVSSQNLVIEQGVLFLRLTSMMGNDINDIRDNVWIKLRFLPNTYTI